MERDEYSGATLGELMFALTEETERVVQNKIDAHGLGSSKWSALVWIGNSDASG